MKLIIVLFVLFFASCEPSTQDRLTEAFDKHQCSFDCMQAAFSRGDDAEFNRYRDSMQKYSKQFDSLYAVKYPNGNPYGKEKKNDCQCH